MVNSTATVLHPNQLRDFGSTVQPRVQQSGRGVWSWAGCRHGRGASLGQECHLVATNSYYVILNPHPIPSSFLMTLPQCISHSQETQIKLYFLHSKDHPFLGS